jgi:hypothetical protein
MDIESLCACVLYHFHDDPLWHARISNCRPDLSASGISHAFSIPWQGVFFHEIELAPGTDIIIRAHFVPFEGNPLLIGIEQGTRVHADFISPQEKLRFTFACERYFSVLKTLS